jgi:hypothetical protein
MPLVLMSTYVCIEFVLLASHVKMAHVLEGGACLTSTHAGIVSQQSTWLTANAVSVYVTFRSYAFALAQTSFNVPPSLAAVSDAATVWAQTISAMIRLRHPNLTRVLARVQEPCDTSVAEATSAAVPVPVSPVPAPAAAGGGKGKKKKKGSAAQKERDARLQAQAEALGWTQPEEVEVAPPPLMGFVSEITALGTVSMHIYPSGPNPFLPSPDAVKGKGTKATAAAGAADADDDDVAPVSVPRFVRKASGPFSLRARLNVAIGLASGLRYLHAHSCVHGDIRSSTMYLEGFETKLSVVDAFSAFQPIRALLPSTEVTSSSSSSSAAVAAVASASSSADMTNFMAATPIAFRAPECMRGDSKPTAASDIWSAACVCLELFAGTPDAMEEPSHLPLTVRVPWFGMQPAEIMAACVDARQPPPQLSSSLPLTLRVLLSKCFAHDPAARPTATQLLAGLLVCSQLYPEYHAHNPDDHQRFSQEAASVSEAVHAGPCSSFLSVSCKCDVAACHSDD